MKLKLYFNINFRLSNSKLMTKSNSNLFTIGFYNVENLFDTQNDPNTHDDDFTSDGKLR